MAPISVCLFLGLLPIPLGVVPFLPFLPSPAGFPVDRSTAPSVHVPFLFGPPPGTILRFLAIPVRHPGILLVPHILHPAFPRFLLPRVLLLPPIPLPFSLLPVLVPMGCLVAPFHVPHPGFLLPLPFEDTTPYPLLAHRTALHSHAIADWYRSSLPP